jgi:hypothetical protein
VTDPHPPAVPVAAPVRVRDRLASAADGPVPVVHRGAHALYVDLAGWCLGLLATPATAVPCALRLAAPTLGGLEDAAAEVRGGTLLLDGRPVRIGRLLDPRVPGLPTPSGSPAPVPDDLVASRVGRGDGLTPYGDDELCGWLAVHRAAGVPTPEVDAEVRAALGRTTLLSATLLDCALHGEVVPEFAAYVAALGTPDEPDRAARLARLGHSSGRGLLAGARLALTRLGIPHAPDHEGNPAA